MNFRHSKILEQARQTGKVTVDGLAEAFDVTLKTIRRDLSDLADQGLLDRVHGGAVLPSGLTNIGYEDRRRLNDLAKAQIGPKCAQLVSNRASVFLGIGTTCEAVARALVHHDGLMVVTNNLNAVPILSASPNCTVIVTGGTVRPSDTGLVGAQAAATVQGFMFDHAIIGCSALDTQGGMFDYDLDEVVVSQAIISNSRQTILVADAAKFDRKAPARICNVSQMDAFVTDQMPVFTPRPETEIIVAV